MVKFVHSAAIGVAAALMLTSAPAGASILYSNGPIDGTHDAWTIDFGYAVADSFQLSTPATLTSADFGAWNFGSDTINMVDWAILNGSPGTGGAVLASGTAALSDTLLFTNAWSYNIFSDSFSLPNLTLAAGTYWLELNNAVVTNGDGGYWDMNGGPSQAWESQAGNVTPCASYYYPSGWCSGTFDIQGRAVPEPASLALIGSGVLASGLLRRRRKLA